jgi:hypothetical protein
VTTSPRRWTHSRAKLPIGPKFKDSTRRDATNGDVLAVCTYPVKRGFAVVTDAGVTASVDGPEPGDVSGGVASSPHESVAGS